MSAPNFVVRLSRVALPAAALLLSSASFAAGPVVYGESAMVKVHPGDAPRGDAGGVGLAAARNEFVGFQVVVHGGASGVTGVSAAIGGLSGPGSIGGDDVTLYREAYLNTTQPSTPDAQTGAWPDGLVPDRDEIAKEQRQAFPFDVPANESRVVWVDVHVPEGAAVGAYSGQVHVTGSGLDANIPVSLTVVDATLPSTPSLKTAFLASESKICEAHTGSQDCNGDAQASAKLADRYQRMALEHRITLPNLFVIRPPQDDWSSFDTAFGPWLDGTAATRLAGAKMTSAQYTWARDPQMYGWFAQHFRQKGWFDRTYDYTGDEPPYGISFADIASRAAQVKQGDPDFKTLVTTNLSDATANGLLGQVDVMVPVVNDINGVEAPNQGDQRAGYDSYLADAHKDLWLYQSCMSHGCAFGTNMPGNGAAAGWPSYAVDASGAKNRGMQWVDFEEKVSGELYYETALALPNAWSDQYQFAGNGDGTLFYPGTTPVIGGATDVPVASIRLKHIRAGVQDYEWLKLVSDAGDPGFAMQVAKAAVPDAHSVGDDGATLDRARLQLMSRYLQLTHKPAAAAAPGSPPANPASDLNSAITSGADPVVSGISGGGTRVDPVASSKATGAKGSGSGGGGCTSTGAAGLGLSALAPLFGLRRRLRRRRRS